MNREPFYKKEIRRGFTISEVMKRSWAADLKILDEIQEICRKIDARIFACYGTLLGAVREHGYIPWDDDLDMGLIGDDYVRFIETIANDYVNRFRILNPYTRTWYKMNFSHIINGGEVSFNREYLEEWCGCPFMTGLDIYPYYYIPRNKNDEEYILEVLEKIDNAIALSRQTETLNNINPGSDSRKRIDELLAVELVSLQHLTGCSFSSDRPLDNQLEILYDQVCRIADETGSDYVTRYDEYTKNRNRKYPKEYLQNIIYIPFEYTHMPCPIGYDDVLKKRFGGNYIVPRQERGAHDYPYYKKQITDGAFFREEIRRGLKLDILTCYNAKDISDPAFKNRIKRKLYHTSAYEMLIHSDVAITTIKDTIEGLKRNGDNAEIWWMPDVFLKTDDYAMDLVAPSLIEEYETLIQQYAGEGIKLVNVTDKYKELTDKFDEYYGDAGVLADEFQKAHKKVVIQNYIDTNIETDVKSEQNNKATYDISDQWNKIIEKCDGSRRKVILYITGLSVLFQNRNSIIEKIGKVLKTFYNNKEEIALIWRPYVLRETDEDIFGRSFVNLYNKLQKNFVEEGWGILDISDDPEPAITIADAVYGDGDYAVSKCIKKGIPVMIQNPDII